MFDLITALISNLLEDEKYQRDAFAAQLIKQDSRHKQICSQVEQIQNELASLTMVEMTKRDLQVRSETGSLSKLKSSRQVAFTKVGNILPAGSFK